MAIQIINDGSCIRIVTENVPFIVQKIHVKTIDTVKNDTVRIDIGAGPLRQIFLPFADVTAPEGLADAATLRDAIKAMLDTVPAGNNNGNGATVDLTPLLSVLQNENSKLLDIESAINTLALHLTGADGSQNIAALKQSVDALGTAIANAAPGVELQLIHDEVINAGNGTKSAIQAMAQQMSGSTATQLSFLAGIQNGVETLAAAFANSGTAASMQAVHDAVVASGSSQAALLTSIMQVLNLIHSSQALNNALLYPVRIDDFNGLFVYNGFVANGSPLTSPADSVWAIQRVTNDGRGTLTYEWANGNQQFSNVWDNRQALQYAPLGTPAHA